MPTRSLDGAGAVKFALGSNIGRVRQLWGVEVSKKQARPKRIYSRSVFFTPAADSKNRCSVGRIRLSSVFSVAGTGKVAKIFNPVIRPYPVYVVNVVAGPNTVDIQPSKSVGLVSVTPQREADIAAVIDRPEANRVFQGNSSTGSSNYSDPHKNASLGVVVKQFAQTCCGKIGLSHDTVPSCSRSCFKVLNESANTLKAVTDSAQSQVAVEAQKTSNLPGFVAMIDVQLLRDSSANSTPVLLHGVQRSVLLDRQAVALAQTLCPGLGGRASLVGVFSQAFRLFGRSTLVALSSVSVTVTRTNAELIDRFIAIASAACFNLKSHDTTTSLIGQRPARVDSTGGLRYFITRSFSWIAEVTKCLYQIASKAVGVCMPTNHCGPFHPYGASAPSIASKEIS